MKTLRKLLVLTLVLTALLSLSACGGKKVTLKILDTEYAVEDYAIAIAKDNNDLLASVNAALATLTENGTKDAIVNKYISGTAHNLTFQADAEGKPELHMATNAQFPPYEFYENNEIVGIDAEMAAAIADELGMKLVIDDMEFDSIITAVQTGKADMGMAGMTVTETRLTNVNFSDSYATGIQVIIVPEDSPIQTVNDLLDPNAKYIAGVQKMTTGDLYLSDTYENGGITADRVSQFDNGSSAIQALITGKVDCVVIDSEPAKAFVAANNK